MQQEIRFCTAPDGVRIAYATVGEGPPLVKVANWLSHLEYDWNSPVWRHWLRELSRHHTLIRYDERGCGLSDWTVEDFSLEAWVQDLETVVDTLGLERFPLLGLSQGGPVALAYAARHPEKVSHLILLGSYARGWLKRTTKQKHIEQAEALLALTGAGWGRDNPAFRQVFTTLFVPEATTEQMRWFSELQRVSTSPGNAVKFLSAFYTLDVRDLAPTVAVPTLVLHVREDAATPFEAGRELATLIPDARFTPLEGKNHVLLENEPAWRRFLAEVRRFLGVEAEKAVSTLPSSPASRALGTHRWGPLSALFERAVALPTDERAAFLDAACADTPALRRELESLLQADEEAGEEAFLDEPAPWTPETPAPSLPATGDPMVGRHVGAYRLAHLIGRGGMGMVYKAFDERLDRSVALKFLSPHLQAHEEIKARFIQEARAASALDHANICTVYDIGETDDGRLFIAMAYYAGQTLKEKIAQGPLSVEESIDIALQVTEGLERAHEAGIVHRDLKPANLALTARGEVKILDFGIAKLEGTAELTKTGARLGTVAYMSPEQTRGEKVDARTDLWSLGVVLYEMLTGERPFRGEYEQAVLYAIWHEEPAPVRAVRPEVSEALAEVVERLLRKDPNARYPTMEDVHYRLLEAMAPSRDRPRRQVEPVAAPPGAERLQETPPPLEASDTWPFSSEEPAPMVGRTEECVYLQERLDKALGGTRQVVFVTGEAGVGKTTLVDAFVRKARDRAILRIGHGQCLEHRGVGEAYMPVLEALGRMGRKPGGQALVALLAKQAPTWLVQMPWLVEAAELDVLQHRVLGATKERMLREMVEAVEALTVRQPLVLILEDLHWSDYPTVDLLAALARRQEPARLLLIGTYRPADVKRSDHPLHAVAQELTLRGYAEKLAVPFLKEAAVRDYLAERFPDTDLPAGLALLVHERTDGNALFMGNVVEAWITQGKLTKTNGAWTLKAELDELAREVPENLRQLIEQKIRHLSAEDRAILEAASVAGMEFSAAAVAAGVDHPEEDVETRCDALARQDQFLRAQGIAEWADGTVAARYGFIHSLYQEVFYDRVPAGRRVRLHRQIGARLETGYGPHAKMHAAELALHFVRGRDAHRAVLYLRHAAKQAMQRSAHQEAIRLLTQGLGIINDRPDLPQRARHELALQAILAPAFILTKGWAAPEAENAFTRARDLCHELGDTLHLIPVLQGLATLYEVRGEYVNAESLMTRHMQDQQRGELYVESHELLACSTFHQGAFKRSLEHAEHGMKRFDPQEHNAFSAIFGDNPGISCSVWAALSLWFLGYPDQALHQLQHSLRLAQTPDNFYGLSHAQEQAAIFHQCRREVDAAREWAEATVAVATRQGVPFRIAAGTILRGWAMTFQGQGEDGINQIRQGLLACDKIGARMDRPYYLGLLAEAYSATDRIEEGFEALDEALATVRSSRTFFYEAELHRLKGVLLLQAGAEPHEAEAAFQQALAVTHRQKTKSLELRAATSLSRLWLRQGKRDEAHPLLAEVYHWFTEGFDTPDLQQAKALLETLTNEGVKRH